MSKISSELSSDNAIPFFQAKVFILIVLTIGYVSPAYSTVTPSGDASVNSSHTGSDYIEYITGAGAITLTVENETTGYVILKPENGAVGNFDQTLILSGNTTLNVNDPNYRSGAVTMQSYSANRNATVRVGEDVHITSAGTYGGGVWIRNETSGNVTIDNAGTVHATGQAGINGVTVLGSASVTNSGFVASADKHGLYAEGAHDVSPVLVNITNSGTVNSYLAGARSINYLGVASINNSGVVVSTTRQGLVAWSKTGSTYIENSGSVTSGDDNAIQALCSNGDVTVVNSGSLIASDDPGIVADRGYSGIAARSWYSGSVAVTNTASGTISAVDDYGIAAVAALGNIAVLNDGSIDALSGVTATSADGAVNVANNGSISVSDRGVFLDGTTNVLTNSSIIETGGTLAVETGDGDATITNYGTISAGSDADTAIGMGDGDNRLILNGSAVIVGNVTNGDGDNTLELTGSSIGILNADLIGDSGQYQGFDSVEKTGDGTWQIAGSSTDINWTVLNGILSVDGYLHSVEVGGGVISGSGSIGSVQIGSGGILAPGNSIGVITTGDVNFLSGSTFEVEVDEDGNSDKLVSTGTVTIDSGSSISVLPENGTDNGSNYDPYTTYTIITAANNVVGTFDAVSDTFAFLDVNLNYDMNNVYLVLSRNEYDFTSIAQSQNHFAVAGAVGSLGAADALYQAVLPLTENGARDAFDQLSGEVYASTQSMLLDDSRFLRKAIISHAHGMPSENSIYQGGQVDTGKKYMVWGSAFGAWGDWDGSSNAATLDRSIGGVITGLDAGFTPSWRIGLTIGYNHSDFDVDARLSTGSVDSYHFGTYAIKQLDALDLIVGAAYSRHQIDTDRTVQFSGFRNDIEADYDAAASQFFGEASYAFSTKNSRISPFLNLAYADLNTDGFTEQGAESALHVSSSSQDMAYSTLGLRVEMQLVIGGISLKPVGSLGWLHVFGDDAPAGDFSFNGSDTFTIDGVSIGSDAAVAEIGIIHTLTDNAAINIAYDGRLSDDASDHSIKAHLTVRF